VFSFITFDDLQALPGLCPVLEDLIFGYLLAVRVHRNDNY
jgi:hypothetical protein